MSNYKTVFFIIGVLQIILGIFMAIPILLQLVLGEIDSSFITSSVITLVFGILFVEVCKTLFKLIGYILSLKYKLKWLVKKH